MCPPLIIIRPQHSNRAHTHQRTLCLMLAWLGLGRGRRAGRFQRQIALKPDKFLTRPLRATLSFLSPWRKAPLVCDALLCKIAHNGNMFGDRKSRAEAQFFFGKNSFSATFRFFDTLLGGYVMLMTTMMTARQIENLQPLRRRISSKSSRLGLGISMNCLYCGSSERVNFAAIASSSSPAQLPFVPAAVFTTAVVSSQMKTVSTRRGES